MGVDSGLPDYRGDQGLWKAYPPLAKLGISFEQISNPRSFRQAPELAWGFTGHRLKIYREASPHEGFELLKRWGQRMATGLFVYTSNVDQQFQKAGFSEEQIVECHGSFHHWQCAKPCCDEIWDAGEVNIEVDETQCRGLRPLPYCPHCKGLARPNAALFGDNVWIAKRTVEQHRRFEQWRATIPKGGLVVIECGAGTEIPSVRERCEQETKKLGGVLIRINPREPDGPAGTLSLDCGALQALRAIDDVMQSPS
jgi:NAD-dependent SIR2 family protein deacetylase